MLGLILAWGLLSKLVWRTANHWTLSVSTPPALELKVCTTPPCLVFQSRHWNLNMYLHVGKANIVSVDPRLEQLFQHMAIKVICFWKTLFDTPGEWELG